MRSTCAMNYHTNRPWNCHVFKATAPNPLRLTRSTQTNGRMIVSGVKPFLSAVLVSVTCLVSCVCDCTSSLKGNLSRWKDLISTQKFVILVEVQLHKYTVCNLLDDDLTQICFGKIQNHPGPFFPNAIKVTVACHNQTSANIGQNTKSSKVWEAVCSPGN